MKTREESIQLARQREIDRQKAQMQQGQEARELKAKQEENRKYLFSKMGTVIKVEKPKEE